MEVLTHQSRRPQPPSRLPPLGAAAAWLVAAYLAVTLFPLLASGLNDTRSLSVLAAHCVALLALVVAGIRRSRGRQWEMLADWLPLLLVPFLYAELPYLIRGAGGPEFRDAVIQVWEQALFRGQPARTVAAALPNVALSELLHAAYLSYYPLIYGPPLLLYVTGRRDAFAETVFVVMLAYVVCFATFVIFPVQGPRYLWPAAAEMPEGPMRTLAVGILERGSSRGAAFPSSHVAVAVAQALMAFRWRARGAAVYAVAAVGLALGAVYGGFHYATDVLVGAGVGVVVSIAGPALYRSLTRTRARS